jgi:hypothetical protein
MSLVTPGHLLDGEKREKSESKRALLILVLITPTPEQDKATTDVKIKQELFVLVFDQRQKFLARDQNPLVIAPGQTDYRGIFLAKGQGNTSKTDRTNLNTEPGVKISA